MWIQEIPFKCNDSSFSRELKMLQSQRETPQGKDEYDFIYQELTC